MDEKALSELLECSVCLDRLDAQSKVLPCQHTFCRWCLEEIITTKKELRCPECRCLVEVDIQDLPANILLIRLLEGMKHAARSGGSSSKSSPARSGDRTGGVPSSPSHGNLAGTHRNITHKNSETTLQPCGKALYSYDASEPGDLSFKKGDVILLRKQVDENWYHGELKGQHGFFPATYIQVLTPLSSKEIPSCKALYDFQSDCNEQDCLIFQKDAVITVIRRIDDNWLEGKLEERIGIFPTSFVELNDAAKMLINFQISLSKNGNNLPNNLNAHTRTTSVPSSSNMSASVTSSTSSDQNASSSTSPSEPSSPPGAITNTTSATQTGLRTDHLMVTPSRASHKRHSLTNLSPVSVPPANHRHSMEISDTMSFASMAVTTTSGTVSAPSFLPIRMADKAAGACASKQPLSPGRTPQTHNSQESGNRPSVSIYMSLYNYKPQKDDEMELKKGEFYCVSEKCQDGWYKGQCLRTGKHGVFPGNYVQPVKMSSSSRSNNIGVSRSPSSVTTTSLISSTITSPSSNHSSQVSSLSENTVVRTRQSGVSRTHSFPKTSPLASLEYQSRLRSLGIRPSLSSHPRPITNITQAQLRSHGHSSSSTVAQTRSQSMLITSADAPIMSTCSSGQVTDQQENKTDEHKARSLPNTSTSPQHQSLLPCPIRTSSSDTKKSHSPRLSRRHTHSDKCGRYSHGHKHSSGSSGRQSCIPSVSTPTLNPAMNNVNTNVNPPNVMVGATGGSPQQTAGKEKKKEKERLPVSLMKKLSAGIPTRMKKSKSPNPDSPKQGTVVTTTATSLAEAAARDGASSPSSGIQGAASSTTKANSNHHRSGSAPATDGDVGAVGMSLPVTQHKKSCSADSTHQGSAQVKPSKVKPLARERYRCIAPYPPQSESELELRVSDIVYVHRKREDGWFKGTVQNSGKTGLFPGSFVEKC